MLCSLNEKMVLETTGIDSLLNFQHHLSFIKFDSYIEHILFHSFIHLYPTYLPNGDTEQLASFSSPSFYLKNHPVC